MRRRRGRLEERTAAAEVPSFLLSLSTTGGGGWGEHGERRFTTRGRKRVEREREVGEIC